MSLSPTYGPYASGPASLARHRNPLQRLGDAVLNSVIRPLALIRDRAKLREELAVLDHRERKDLGISDLDTFIAGWRPDQRA